jgi:SAM-dependent methyltransferase
MSERFKDHFSGHANAYAAARPTYPPAMFDWLASVAPTRSVAWDAGTGSGQAAVELGERFASVIATDASEQQVAHAQPHEHVRYRVARAEASGLEAGSVDLATAAQAVHWFDLGAYWAEVRRVLRPGGVVAVWCYGWHRVTPEIDALSVAFRRRIDPWWPPERAMVENGYADVVFPFNELAMPPFAMTCHWQLRDVLAYLRTWSAVKRYEADTGEDPVVAIEQPMREAWGDRMRDVTWPLSARIGRV